MDKLKSRITIATIMALACGQVAAQTQRSGGDIARVVQQLQQVTAEKSQLQQDNESLKKELEQLKAKSAQAGAEQARLQQRARELELASNKLQSKSSGSDEALEKSRAQLQELIGKYRELTQTLKDVETDREALRAADAVRQRDLSSCVDKNVQMYLLTDEILGRMENQGVWTALKDKEPFTKLSRTRLENLIDDYRYRVSELRLAAKSASTKSP